MQTGDVYNVHVVTHVDTDVTINAEDKQANQDMDINMSMKVQDVDKDHNATLYCQYDSIQFSTSAGKSDPFSDALIGKGFSIKVDPKGDVLEVSGVNERIDQVVDAMTVDEQRKQELRKLMQQSLGDQALKTMMDRFGHLPEQVSHVGDSWEDTVTTQAMCPVTVKTKWTLLSDHNGILAISEKGVISTAAQINEHGVPITINLTGSCQGNIQVHKEQAFLRSGTVLKRISGTMALKDPRDPSDTITVPVTIASRLVFEITKQ